MPREQTSSGHSPDVAGSEFFDTLREMGRNWMGRASAEVERGSKLSKDLSGAHTVPDAVTAYQGWLSGEMNARVEDVRQVISDGQKLMETGARLLTNSWTSIGTTT